MAEYCRFCKKTLAKCSCDEDLFGNYFNVNKAKNDPWG